MGKKDEEDIERPICGCGKPATHVVKLSVHRLVLDREAGARAEKYWSIGFRAAHTNLEAVVCDECVSGKIRVTVAVDATLEKAKKKDDSSVV